MDSQIPTEDELGRDTPEDLEAMVKRWSWKVQVKQVLPALCLGASCERQLLTDFQQQ